MRCNHHIRDSRKVILSISPFQRPFLLMDCDNPHAWLISCSITTHVRICPPSTPYYPNGALPKIRYPILSTYPSSMPAYDTSIAQYCRASSKQMFLIYSNILFLLVIITMDSLEDIGFIVIMFQQPASCRDCSRQIAISPGLRPRRCSAYSLSRLPVPVKTRPCSQCGIPIHTSLSYIRCELCHQQFPQHQRSNPPAIQSCHNMALSLFLFFVLFSATIIDWHNRQHLVCKPLHVRQVLHSILTLFQIASRDLVHVSEPTIL
jgi:hypothetical protein